MRYARWHESLETGDLEVDTQHRELYDLVNDLNAQSVLDVDAGLGNKALTRIIEYASAHFSAEEALMTRYGYADIDAHRSVHGEFAEAAQRLVSEHAAGRGPRLPELAAFMEEWLGRHISTFDQPMVDHVRAHREQAEPK